MVWKRVAGQQAALSVDLLEPVCRHTRECSPSDFNRTFEGGEHKLAERIAHTVKWRRRRILESLKCSLYSGW